MNDPAFPSTRGVRPSGAFGRELKTDDARIGYVDDGNLASPERLAEARLRWPEARAEEFEALGRHRWRDRSSGTVYAEPGGAPLLSAADANRGIVAFFVGDDNRLHFLARTDIDLAVTTVVSGPMRSGVVVEGAIRWEGT